MLNGKMPVSEISSRTKRPPMHLSPESPNLVCRDPFTIVRFHKLRPLFSIVGNGSTLCNDLSFDRPIRISNTYMPLTGRLLPLHQPSCHPFGTDIILPGPSLLQISSLSRTAEPYRFCPTSEVSLRIPTSSSHTPSSSNPPSQIIQNATVPCRRPS